MKKSLLHGIAAACFWFALATPPHAQTGTPEFDPLGEYDDLPRQIRVQVEFIDVSHEQLTELMSGSTPPANDAELRKRAGQLVKDGKATILETMLCIARSGQRATAESIEEFIYPTEYEPAKLAGETRPNEKEEAGNTKAAPRDFATGPTEWGQETHFNNLLARIIDGVFLTGVSGQQSTSRIYATWLSMV